MQTPAPWYGSKTGFEIHPDADDEPYDNIDQDCAGDLFNDWDQDGDGYTLASPSTPGEYGNANDCDDDAEDGADAWPGKASFDAEDVWDGQDNDCDPEGRDECFADADRDGYGSVIPATIANDAGAVGCLSGELEAAEAGDCDDGSDDAYPGKVFDDEDVQDGEDNDCDGLDECFADYDRDGFGSLAPQERARLEGASVVQASAAFWFRATSSGARAPLM